MSLVAKAGKLENLTVPTDIVVGDQLTLFCTDGGTIRVQTYRVIDSQLQLFSHIIH